MSRERRMEPMGQGMGFGGARVYVGDIGNRIRRTDLQREFEHYGQVLDVWMTPQETRQDDRNFAFVVFRYPEDAAMAVRDSHGRLVCGRKVRVEHAKPPRSQADRYQDYQRGRGGRGMGYSGYNSRGGRGGGSFNRGDYYNMASRQPPPQLPRSYRQRSRSYSPRERSYRRSPPMMNNGSRLRRQPSYEVEPHYQSRNRNDHYDYSPPPRRMERPPSFSPDHRSRKEMMNRTARHDSRSISRSPPPRQQPPQTYDSGSFESRSPSPPPKKVKKKKKKHAKSRSRSRSESPPPSSNSESEPRRRSENKQQYYSSEEEYERKTKSHKSKKSKSKKKKKREIESGEDYSSGDSY